jgi:hypothetical protein
VWGPVTYAIRLLLDGTVCNIDCGEPREMALTLPKSVTVEVGGVLRAISTAGDEVVEVAWT